MPRAFGGAAVGNRPFFGDQQPPFHGGNLENVANFARTQVDAIDHVRKFPREEHTHPFTSCINRRTIPVESLCSGSIVPRRHSRFLARLLRTPAVMVTKRKPDRRVSSRCPKCGESAVKKETIVAGSQITSSLYCPLCNAKWPERRQTE